MTNLPQRIEIREEGPREGFQFEPPGIATANKVRLIEALADAGLAQIACASFVDPKRVPQMADSHEIAGTIRRKEGVRYIGLWLNERGFERALGSGIDMAPGIVASGSEQFSIKNNNCGTVELLARQKRMLELYAEHSLPLAAAHVFTAFGCYFEGDIPQETVLQRIQSLLTLAEEHNSRVPLIYLCDTIGAANPRQIQDMLGKAKDRWPDQPFALHLHDTRGMGLANALAGMQMGVTVFDTSIGGMGGCPFAGHRSAAGNIATEDLALMCAEMGVETGLDVDALISCAKQAAEIVGHELPGKSMHAGRIPHTRVA